MSNDEDAVNPKDKFGLTKVGLSYLSGPSLAHEALALQYGAAKYGRTNFRQSAILATIYIDAALRHIFDWVDGEEYASDSGIHHLGHAKACLAIILDAMHHGTLKDDRPVASHTADVFESLEQPVSAAPSDAQLDGLWEDIMSTANHFASCETLDELTDTLRHNIKERIDRSTNGESDTPLPPFNVVRGWLDELVSKADTVAEALISNEIDPQLFNTEPTRSYHVQCVGCKHYISPGDKIFQEFVSISFYCEACALRISQPVATQSVTKQPITPVPIEDRSLEASQATNIENETGEGMHCWRCSKYIGGSATVVKGMWFHTACSPNIPV